MSVEAIKAQVDKLSLAEKRELLHYLRDTGAEEDNFELSEEWKVELDERRKRLKADLNKGMPFREFIQPYLNHQ